MMARLPRPPDSIFEALKYFPETGEFRWTKALRGSVKVGKKAGCVDCRGYVAIGFMGRVYRGHHLAWLLATGEWASSIDHVNLVRSDNRLTNIRPATIAQNTANSPKRAVDHRLRG
jgi:hypothetical protein